MAIISKLISYWFMLFTIGFGWFILAPLIPGIMQSYNITLTVAILLVSLYGYTMVILGLLGGYLAAKFTVKNTIYIAAILSVIGLVGRAVSPDFSLFFIFALIAAASYPLALAPVGSISESIAKEKSHTIIGVSVGVLFLGMAVGAFAGPGIFGSIGLNGSMWITAILAVIAAIWIAFSIKDYPTFYKGKSLKGSFKIGMIKNWYVGLSIASMSGMFGGIASTMLILNKFPLASAMAYGGLLGGLAFLGSALGAIILPPIFEKYNSIKKGLILTSILSFISVSILAYYLSFNPFIALLATVFFLFGFFGNAYWSMALASTTKYVSDPAQAGFATSMYSVLTNLGVALIPVFLGPLFESISLVWFAVGIVIAIEFVAFVLSFTLRTKPNGGKAAK